jgi:ABC-type transport system involved in cytochrome c biogenesis permease subunit
MLEASLKFEVWSLEFLVVNSALHPVLCGLRSLAVEWFSGQHADRHFFLLAVVVYGVSMMHSVFLWRKGFRKDSHVSYGLLLLGFGFHSGAMVLRGFSLKHCPVTNLYEATAFVMWTIVAAYLVMGVWARLRFLGAFASPALFAIGVFALMPGLDVSRGARPEFSAVLTSLHAALMALSYGAFGLSSVAALMFLSQERNLKLHKLRAVFSLMPPIQRLETAVGYLLLSGFVLLTLGLGIGAYDLARTAHPDAYRGDPKIMWSLLVWLLYFGLIVMRWKFAQGGRRFALGAIGSFTFVLLTFWGSNLLSPLHNP